MEKIELRIKVGGHPRGLTSTELEKFMEKPLSVVEPLPEEAPDRELETLEETNINWPWNKS